MRTNILLIVILLFCSCNNNSGSTNNGDNVQTKKIKEGHSTTSAQTFKPQDYNIPNEVKYIKQKFDFLHSKFRPLGWSSDGKLAYVIEPADEACGCYFFEIYVQDMRSDKILYEFKFNDEGMGENISSIWDKNYEIFKKELNKHQITQTKSNDLQKRKFKINEQNYEVKIKTERAQDPDFMIEMVKNTKVFILKNGKEKQVMDQKTSSGHQLINVTLPGVLASPYEERIAIVLQEEQRGWEGPPNVLSIHLTGASLTKGF